MAITYTGTGGLMTRLGSLIYTINTIDTHRYQTMESRVADLYGEFASNDQKAIDNLFTNRDNYRTTHDAFVSQLITTAANILVTQVDRTETLSDKTLAAALQKVYIDMVANSASISAPTLGATFSTVTGVTNQTDAKFAASTIDSDGVNLNYMFAETIDFACTGGTDYAETFTIQGDPAVASQAYNWPLGSGASGSLALTNAASTTKLTDGDFETWADANTPTYWTGLTGTGGTHYGRGTSSKRNSYCMRLTSDGSTLTTLYQDVTSGMAVSTVYAVCFWAKIDTADASGSFRVRLVDGSNTVISDAASTANSFSTATNGGSGIGTSYAAFTGFFRTPKVLPSAVRLQFGLAASPANGRTLDIDLLAMTPATQLYTGGPWVAAFSGSSKAGVGDRFLLTTTSNQGTSSFGRSLDRLFNLRQLGVKLPTSGSPTIADGLIA